MNDSRELDGRRINPVTPLPFGGNETMLENLMLEQKHLKMKQDPPSFAPESTEDAELRKAKMIDAYQSTVLQNEMIKASLHDSNYLQLSNKSTNSSHASSSQSMSHSQPCLVINASDAPSNSSNAQFFRCSSTEHEPATGLSRHVGNTQKIVNSLRDENRALKKQIEAIKTRSNRVQQLEDAYKKIEMDYERLLRTKDEQEQMELTGFAEIEKRMQRLAIENKALSEKLSKVLSHGLQLDFQQEIARLNHYNSSLHKDVESMRQTISSQGLQIQAQHATLEDQRTYINTLEAALANTQDRLARKEKMCEEQHSTPERLIADWEQLLRNTVAEMRSKEKAHAEERERYKMELAQYKVHFDKEIASYGGIKIGLARPGQDDQTERLKKTIAEKEKRISSLEKKVLELQQNLSDACEKKTAALNSVSENLEATIKRLEDEKLEKDRRIAELTEDKKQLAELLEKKQEDESARRDMHRMEKMRQQIDERRRRQRVSNPNAQNTLPSTTLLAESSPGSPSLHAPLYDGLAFDSSSLLSQFSQASRLSNSSSNTFSASFSSKPQSSYSATNEEQPSLLEGGTVWNV